MFTDFITILDLIGIAVVAATGSLVASRKKMDLIGFGRRAGAIYFGWSLPRYKQCAGRIYK
ncbi:MAG: TRIC cation channel family protein [Sneathiella sp.]|nr:TRIC cation channel family protein [Sneathiella sp.]